jgi:hypothetical protein
MNQELNIGERPNSWLNIEGCWNSRVQWPAATATARGHLLVRRTL